MSTTTTEAVKASVDCRALLASYGVRFAPGATGNAHCWHDTNHQHGDRSASVQVHRDGFKCHGCGAFGDVFDVVQHFEGVGFASARQILAEHAGIDSPTPRTRTLQRRNAAVVRPVQTPTPAAMNPDVRREILGRIWDCLTFAEQPARLFDYGKRRGVSADTMRLTVRDWTAVAREVVGIWDEYEPAALVSAGVLRADETPWRPFEEVRAIAAGNKRSATGFIVPVFDGTSSAPVGFRWRFYYPRNGFKAAAQPGAGLPLIGLDTIERARAAGPYIVVICEGETDWLAAIDAARSAGINAAVVAHCSMATRWRAEWTAMLTGADGVLIGFDEGKGNTPAGDARAGEIVRGLAEIHGRQWARQRVTIALTREGMRDFADLHKDGLLTPIISLAADSASNPNPMN